MALRSELRVRVGCVNDHFTYGWNRKHSHPKLVEWGYPEHSDIHSEMDLAIQGEHTIYGRTIYVARITRDGEWALARPCAACMGMLAYLEARRVIWTVAPGQMGMLKL